MSHMFAASRIPITSDFINNRPSFANIVNLSTTKKQIDHLVRTQHIIQNRVIPN